MGKINPKIIPPQWSLFIAEHTLSLLLVKLHDSELRQNTMTRQEGENVFADVLNRSPKVFTTLGRRVEYQKALDSR
jgi:hypothetical protein